MSKRAPAARRRRLPRTHSQPPAPDAARYEADVVEGLEGIAAGELVRLLGAGLRQRPAQQRGSLAFDYSGPMQLLLQLRTVQSIYLVRSFDVPRPRALLGDQHLRALLASVEQVRGLAPVSAYQSFYLSAAGAESAVLLRLKQELARHTGLAQAPEGGDLLLRLRRAADGTGWELLLRLSPRPLATRAWRVCNLQGALNASVAHAMVLLTRPAPDETFLNPLCGSATLLIERLAAAAARQAVGCDTSAEALACARANVEAAGLTDRLALHGWDARALPLPDASVDALCADLPFGHLVGRHSENQQLYPLLLQEAARVARPGARWALISHEVRLMESLLSQPGPWALERQLRITLGTLHPRIYLLRRVSSFEFRINSQSTIVQRGYHEL